MKSQRSAIEVSMAGPVYGCGAGITLPFGVPPPSPPPGGEPPWPPAHPALSILIGAVAVATGFDADWARETGRAVTTRDLAEHSASAGRPRPRRRRTIFLEPGCRKRTTLALVI